MTWNHWSNTGRRASIANGSTLMEVKRLKLAALVAALISSTATAEDIVIANVGVISMLESGVQAGQNVTVRGGKIVAIDEGDVTTGARVIDGSGRFLIPGLAEMHAHVPVENPDRDDALFLWVANGVTMARGMVGHRTHLALREDLLAHRTLGPRLFTSGPPFIDRVSSTVGIAALVREQKEAGYDFVKILGGLSGDEFDAIATAAREVGISFAGHVTESVGLQASLEAGQTTAEHLDGYMQVITPDVESYPDAYGAWFGAALAPYVDLNLIPRAVAMTKAAGGAVVPTETLLENSFHAYQWEAMTKRPQFKYLPKALRTSYIGHMKDMAPGTSAEKAAEFLGVRKILIKALHDGGVPVLLGSDAPQMFNVQGFAIHRELAAMVAAGLTPFEALATGTTAPAAFLGTSDWGAIEAGRDADLVLLNANPLRDIANTQRIEAVMVRGRWLDRAAIDAGLNDIEKRYR